MEPLKEADFVTEAKNFFNSYKKQIGEAVRRGDNIVFVNFEDLALFSPDLSEMLLENPEEVFTKLEIALEETELIKKPRIRFIGLPENNFVKIRNIRAKHLNKFVCVEGLVRQASDVRPQVVSAKFECPSCGTIISVLQLEKKFKEPSRCSCGRKGFFKLISKQMVDAQRLVVEEAPDALIGGEQPRRLNVFLKEDLVEPRMEEKTTPGSRVKVFGILNEVPVPLPTGSVSTRFDLAVDANNIVPTEESYDDLKISEEDENQIKELSVDSEVFKKLSDSIAPSIYGYDEIKQSIVLQLFGGVKKIRSDGTLTRGDIHILLVGDPGVAKSITLGFIAKIAPKGRYVVGKSASGAGLTATVVRDEFLKGWSLEAGAMVLSNKGILCIDEIDKMDEQDRSAMHEALEQQTVTISKANVQACYSEDTEVLTEEGWKKYKDVKNLKIAQYNPLDNTIKFLSHKGLYVYSFRDKMYHFKDKSNDILVTPNHSMLIKREKQNNFEKINAEDIKSYRFKIRNSGKFLGKENKTFILPAIKHKQNRKHVKYIHQHVSKKIPMDLWLEFLGYYVSEGGIETAPTIGIVQKKGFKADKIKKVLTNLTKVLGCSLSEIDCGAYVRFKITQTQLYDYLKKLGKNCYNKTSCLNFSEFSKRQLTILYNAMMLGDGSSDGKSFGSTSKKLIDEFQIVAHLIGKSASQHVHYDDNYRGNRKRTYRVSLSDRIEPGIKRSSVKRVKYNGSVFCFSTDTGFFVTRRNGKIAIQGNTLRAETSVLAAGNPKYGRFDPYLPIAQQVEIQPTLLNRFDVIFMLRDLPDKKNDDAIATHVLEEQMTSESKIVLEPELFKKYVAYAKQKVHPKLTQEAVDELKKFYIDLRNAPTSSDSAVKPIPITARQLNSLVRLAEASAKTRLSEVVEVIDSQRAINILKYYLMQAGYDYETKSFDIDKIVTGVTASKRGKIMEVKESINKLEDKIGKLIPIEELEKDLEGKVSKLELEEALEKLSIAGDIFHPKKGFVQSM